MQYQAQWDQKETLARFDIDTIQKPPLMKGKPTCMKRFKIADWRILEEPYSSRPAKVHNSSILNQPYADFTFRKSKQKDKDTFLQKSRWQFVSVSQPAYEIEEVSMISG